jgi:hypothetical protein
MAQINIVEVDRKIGYWQYILSKIERDMFKMQSKRVDIKQRLTYLNVLRKQEEMIA